MGAALAEKQIPNQGPADEEAIARVLAGEGQAFEVLVERYKPLVARIVAAKVPRQEAPEVAQEAFIRAFESLANYRPIKPFGNWLAAIAVRASYDFWRERYRDRKVSLEALSQPQLARLESEATGRDESALDRYEAWELLDWALGHLSAADRLALTLVHLEGYSVAEAAELLGWSGTNVKVRTLRARRKLRRIISRAFPAGGD